MKEREYKGMNHLQYNVQLHKLCSYLQLGDMVNQQTTLSGGLLHRMYRIETTKGKYAIKALNPEVMSRPTAMKNYINSEKIVSVVSNSKIPALPAIQMNGNVIHNVDNQYYLVFPWINGKSLEICDITCEHCKIIGSILADVHSTDFSELNIDNEISCENLVIDWNKYLQMGRESKSVWTDLLYQSLDNFYFLTSCADKGTKTLAADMVISHRDLDSKNIMWNLGNPIVIDWEAAGYINPLQELTETALCLAGYETGSINKDNFCAVVNSYYDKRDRINIEWKMVLETGFAGKLGWLEYNMKRSLGISCADEEEQKLGTEQVIATIHSIKYYANLIPVLVEWLNEGETEWRKRD